MKDRLPPRLLAIAPIIALIMGVTGVPATAASAPAPPIQTGTIQTGTGARALAAFEPLPALPINACNNASLPRSYGTNFPTPTDPFGFGWRNQSAIGWPENWYAPFAYLSGSYFARGVPVTFTQSGRSYCGAMYSFGAYTFGLA